MNSVASAATGQVTRPSWRKDVQGLRGIAVLLVVLYHAGLPVPGGFIGVDVFFVISGFVIVGSLARQITDNSFRARDFFWNRFRRLIPALSVLVVLVTIASLALQSPIRSQPGTAAMGLASMLSVANVVAYFQPTGYFQQGLAPNPLLNTWSLSVEEQFYLGLVVGIVLLGILLRRSARGITVSALVWMFCLVTAGSLLLCLASSFRTPGTLPWVPSFLNPDFAFYSPFTRAWEFGAGALLALAQPRIPVFKGAWLLRWIGLALILLAALRLTKDVTFPGFIVMVPVMGTVLVILAGTAVSMDRPSRLLTSRSLVSVGDWSYSWYLWHWPLIVFVVAIWGSNSLLPVVAAAISVIPALLSYRFIEQPFRRMKLGDWKRNARRLLFWYLPPIGAAAVLLLGSTTAWADPGLRAFATQTDPYGDLGTAEAECPVFVTDFGIGSTVCEYPADGTEPPIYLVGDSNAGQFARQIAELSQDRGRSLTLATQPGCPFLGVDIWWNEPGGLRLEDGCREFGTRMLEKLLSDPPGLVILSSSLIPLYTTHLGVSANGGVPSIDEPAKVRALQQGLGVLVETLQQHGHEVALIDSIPTFFVRSDSYWYADMWRPEQCIAFRWLTPATGCGASRSIAQLDAYQGPSREVFRSVAAEYNLPLIDPRIALCRDGTCSTNQSNTWLYLDGSHLNVTGVRLVKPLIAQLLDDSGSSTQPTAP